MSDVDWNDLSHKMAIDAIKQDLMEIYIPAQKAEERAILALESKNNAALNVEHRMIQALIALKNLGFTIIPPAKLK